MTKRRRTVLALVAVAAAVPALVAAVDTASAGNAAADKAAAKPLRIMLTNDDGPGGGEYLTALRDALCAAGYTVTVVVPSTDQSGNGTRITGMGTLADAISMFPCGSGQGTQHAISASTPANASPADAVLFGLGVVFAGKAPDLVVSGMNPGGNFGNVTNHSGTVGAAATAIEKGVPGIAVSIEHDGVDAGKAFAAELAARPKVATFVTEVITQLQKNRGKGDSLIPGGGLNINWPITYNKAGTAVVPPRGARITRIGSGDAIVLGYTKNAGGDYEIAAGICGAPTPCGGEHRAHADTTAIKNNWISVSPLDADWSRGAPGALTKRLRALL